MKISDYREDQQLYSNPEFLINEELLKELRTNMDPNYTPSDRILYYYFKLCFLFGIDSEYNFCNFVDKVSCHQYFKKSIENLPNIVPYDEVSCFEFTAILDHLIELEGGEVEKHYYQIEDYGTSTHFNTMAIIDNRLFVFDPLEDILGSITDCDMCNVKLNKGYNGVIVNEEDFGTGEISYDPRVAKIYQDVQKEFSWYLKQTKFNQESLDYTFSIVNNLTLSNEDKNELKDWFLRFDSIPLNKVDYYRTIIKSFASQVRKNNHKFNLCGVGNTIDGYNLSLILSAKQDNNNYIYFEFGNHKDIRIYTKEQLEDLIMNNKIVIKRDLNINEQNEIITSYKFIDGIDKQVQIDGHKKMIDNFQQVFDDIYKRSLGEGEEKLLKNKNDKC